MCGSCIRRGQNHIQTYVFYEVPHSLHGSQNILEELEQLERLCSETPPTIQ